MRTLRKPKLMLLACALAAIIFIVLKAALASRSDTIPHHLRRLAEMRQSTAWKSQPDLPGNLSRYVQPQLWLWYLRGAPTQEKWIKEMEQHRQALIRLGYFERREFTFTTRTQWYSDFRALMSNTVFADTNWWIHLDTAKPQSVLITASKKDIPKFELIVSQIDLEATK